MNQKKLNTATLSGLIVGPVMGSGVILLPPLLYNSIGQYALLVWIVISLLGLIFAGIFGRLAILYPGDGGVSLATKAALGKKYQLLTSFFLIAAVFFGPVAVLLIAAEFLQSHFLSDENPVVVALIVYIITYLMLLIRIDFLGKLMLFITTTITVIFLISSVVTLLQVQTFVFSLPPIELKTIGYSFLLAFWALVGWEVIGNYSNEVKNRKTLINAVIFSAIMVALIYILLASAISFGDFHDKLSQSETFKLVWIIEKAFGSVSNILLTIISSVLCIGTLILFVGGVARLASSLKLTSYTSKHLSTGSPIGALNALAVIHLIVLVLVYFDYFDISKLVAFANAFFIANAIIGLMTAIRLFENGLLKWGAYLLIFIFLMILMSSNIFILAIILALFLFVVFFKPEGDRKEE